MTEDIEKLEGRSVDGFQLKEMLSLPCVAFSSRGLLYSKQRDMRCSIAEL